LVALGQITDPSEQSLNRRTVNDRREWARRVFQQLSVGAPRMKQTMFLTGHRYCEFLTALLEERHVAAGVPIKRLRIGEQLRWLGIHDE
jgi:hypothetical protein